VFKNRIAIPESAKAGALVEIKTLVSHPMESGFRRDAVGKVRPRNIIKRFVCHYNDTMILDAEFFPGVAANPYLSFFFRATESGQLTFLWTDQHGNETSETRSITVHP
jgi:sulfur-oxidizing protein SoxZ